MYLRQPHQQQSRSTSCQIATHTCLLLPPKKIPALVFSAWGCVFFFVRRNSCLHSPFSPKQGKGKQKHNEGIKADYRLSEFWNTKGLCACVGVKCMCFYSGVKHVYACVTDGCEWVCACVCVWTWRASVRDENLFIFSLLVFTPSQRNEHKSLSSIKQSKQLISEKLQYKNTGDYKWHLEHIPLQESPYITKVPDFSIKIN